MAANGKFTQHKPLLHLPGVPCRTPVHPGYFLQTQYFGPLGLNQTVAARVMGVSRRRVNEIILGHRSLSADTALRCAAHFGADAGHLMALQAAWDLHQTWKKQRNTYAIPVASKVSKTRSVVAAVKAVPEHPHLPPALHAVLAESWAQRSPSFK